LTFLINLEGELLTKRARIIPYLTFFVLIIGCGGVPPTYYYRIHYDMPEHNSPTPLPVTIIIEPFDADALYKGDRIVFRNSEYEVQFYHYRRWVAPPNKIVQESVIEQFRASGVFERVVTSTVPVNAGYILKGNIKSFEEWDEGDSWYGLVSIAFELRNKETKEIVWQNTFSERTPAFKKEPTEVAKAISESLKKIVEKAIREVEEKLSSQQ
jgi:ABC-type uncharacterized transport system auxiliary subunit